MWWRNPFFQVSFVSILVSSAETNHSNCLFDEGLIASNEVPLCEMHACQVCLLGSGFCRDDGSDINLRFVLLGLAQQQTASHILTDRHGVACVGIKIAQVFSMEHNLISAG